MDFNIEKKGYDPHEVDEYIRKLKSDYEASLSEQKQRIFELKKALAQAEANIKTYKERSDMVSKAIMSAVQKAEEIEKLTQQKYFQEIEQLKAFHEKWMAYYNKILTKYPLDDDLAAASRFNMQMKSILSRLDSESLSDTAKSLENNYEKEKERLSEKPAKQAKTEEKRIGYVTVKTGKKEDDDTELLKQLIPGMDTSSPILSGNFDPVERINKYLAGERAAKNSDADTAAASTPAPAVARAEKKSALDLYTDRSDLGFSFTEALNPKEDLAQIMKDLGLLLEEN